MSSTAGDEGQGGWFGVNEVRTRGLPLVAIFTLVFTILLINVENQIIELKQKKYTQRNLFPV